MNNTLINPRQLRSTSTGYLNLYDELSDMAVLQADSLMDVDVEFTYDGEGNVIKETVSSTDTPAKVIRETEFVYNASGGIDYELITRGSVSFKRTYQYNGDGNITGYTARKIVSTGGE